MISNTSHTPQLRGRTITLEMIQKPTSTKDRRTKIVCTLGPASWSAKGIAALMDGGMNVARCNMKSYSHEAYGEALARLRQVAKEKSRNVAVLVDTEGPSIRTGLLQDDVESVKLEKGDFIMIKTGESDSSFLGNATSLYCNYPKLPTLVQKGQQIIIAGGWWTVVDPQPVEDAVVCRVECSMTVRPHESLHLPGVDTNMASLTDKDISDIEFAIEKQVEFVAISAGSGQDVERVRELLQKAPAIKILSKIENQKGLRNYADILAHSDGIIVARGNLGREMAASKVFMAQKFLIRQANIAGKPVITATQMLESMLHNPRPTRAECSDVANAVLDGTDAVMLMAETAEGPYIENVMSVMERTCCEAEGSQNSNVLTYGGLSVGESVSSSAVKTCIDVQARLIVVFSDSGRMAAYVAKFRPGVPVLCLMPKITAARQCSGLLMGVHTILVDSLANTEELIEEVNHAIHASGMVSLGDKMVVIAGRKAGMKEQMLVVDITEGKPHGHIVKEGCGFYFNSQMVLNYSQK